MSQYIGKTISLISNSNIRYVGVLHEINSVESTVSLESVRSFGTEGRRNGVDEIPASDSVYEFIVFRGSDVKDLKIADSQHAPPPQPQFQDPAIIQSQAPYPPSSNNQMPAAPQNYAYPPQNSQRQQPQAQESKQAQSSATPAQQQAPTRTAPPPAAPAVAPTGPKENARPPSQQHNNSRSGPAAPQQGGRPKIKNDFDFDTNNAKFTKEETAEDQDESFYDKKSSFFDNISSTAKERSEGSSENQTAYERRGEERKLNMETFGQAQIYHNNNRGGRGRGRGGYNRGRGGNRGGYRGRGGYRDGGEQFQQQPQQQA